MIKFKWHYKYSLINNQTKKYSKNELNKIYHHRWIFNFKWHKNIIYEHKHNITQVT